MKISKAELLTKLMFALPCTSEKSPVAQMTMFTFTSKELLAFNSIAVCKVDFESDFIGCIGAKDLYDLVRTAPCEEIALMNADDRMKISGTGLKGFLMFNVIDEKNPIDFNSIFDQMPVKKLQLLPDGLLEGMDFCKWAATDKETMGIFSCIQIDGKDVVAGDAYRFSLYECEGISETFIIPSSVVSTILFMNPTKIGISEKFVWFKGENTTLGVRRSFGTFPKVRDLLKKVGKGQKITLPETLKEALEVLRLFLSPQEASQRYVTLKSEKSCLRVSGKREAGEITRTLALENPADFEFRVNVDYLLDIISHSYTLTLSENKTMALFSGKNFYHLIALIQEV